MATYYYKGIGFNTRNESDGGVSVDGYVDAKSKKDALLKIRAEIGCFIFDSIGCWNGTTGKVIATSQYNQPIAFSGGEYVWIGK